MRLILRPQIDLTAQSRKFFDGQLMALQRVGAVEGEDAGTIAERTCQRFWLLKVVQCRFQ